MSKEQYYIAKSTSLLLRSTWSRVVTLYKSGVLLKEERERERERFDYRIELIN